MLLKVLRYSTSRMSAIRVLYNTTDKIVHIKHTLWQCIIVTSTVNYCVPIQFEYDQYRYWTPDQSNFLLDI